MADQHSTRVVPFAFPGDGKEVRIVTLDNGEPGFVARDVAERLGYANASDAINKHCKGVAIRYPLQTGGGVQELRIITEPDVLRLIISSTLPAAQAFERWVFDEVLPSIRKTGRYEVQQTAAPIRLEHSYADAMAGAEVACRVLRLEGSAALGMLRAATSLTAPHLLPMLPTYAIDAPADAPKASSEPTASATELLKRHGVKMTAAVFNMCAINRGLLEKRERPSTTRGTKTYLSLTDTGLLYGKNLTNPNNPRETQPHWYCARFGELLQLVLGREGGAA